jgi:ATP-dependent DNA ligase
MMGKVDGEIVALDKDGLPRFDALRHLSTAAVYRQMMKRRLAVWEDVVVGAQPAV